MIRTALAFPVVTLLASLALTSAFAQENGRANMAPSAAGTRIETGIGPGGAADLLNNTTFDPDKPSSPTAKKSRVKLSANCTDSAGKELKKGDAGYDQCVSQAQMNRVGAPGSPQPGAGATFQIGD